MNFTCEKSKLQEAINIVQKAITGKSTMKILQGILILAKGDQLTLIGSDIDLSIETKINADVKNEGKIVLDSRLFGDIIKKLPNSLVEIKTNDDNNIEISCEKSNFVLVPMDVDNYPELPTIDENKICSISQKLLKNMIKSTIFAVAQDETRPILTGVLFEIKNNKLNLVALDSFRLALKNQDIDNENEISCVIPSKTLNEVSRILEDENKNVDMSFTKNHILFNLENTKIMSRLLEGNFIKYDSIIPDEYNLKVIAKREEFLSCIERASLMCGGTSTNLVKLDIKDDNIIITSNSQLGKVREELNIILQGEPLQIAFNSRYLIDVLKIMDEDEICMELSSSVSPCIIKNKEVNNCTYLVLPVRMASR